MKTTFAILLACIAVLIPSAVPIAHAQTLTILYSFTNPPDGVTPEQAGVFRDKRGNLYGTTCCGGTTGWGTVFRIDTKGGETVLYSFTSNPVYPNAGVTMDKAGNLYGTTIFFGGEYCCGVVFKLDPSGKFAVLHQFSGQPDGASPASVLVTDKKGNLYGTTGGGGSFDLGTVFKLDSSGHETVLHSFSGGDGQYPFLSSLVMDREGNLYGTTYGGGSAGKGTVFKLDSSGKETVLHSFSGPDGASPMGGLVVDNKGNLYGTTFAGGSADLGAVFRLDTAGNETVLHNFTDNPDGSQPWGTLAIDQMGNLYGTSSSGGSSGVGILFEIDTYGNETVLHTFTDLPDGATPSGGLIIDKRRHLYGTTVRGGDHGHGTVFELVP